MRPGVGVSLTVNAGVGSHPHRRYNCWCRPLTRAWPPGGTQRVSGRPPPGLHDQKRLWNTEEVAPSAQRGELTSGFWCTARCSCWCCEPFELESPMGPLLNPLCYCDLSPKALPSLAWARRDGRWRAAPICMCRWPYAYGTGPRQRRPVRGPVPLVVPASISATVSTLGVAQHRAAWHRIAPRCAPRASSGQSEAPYSASVARDGDAAEPRLRTSPGEAERGGRPRQRRGGRARKSPAAAA